MSGPDQDDQDTSFLARWSQRKQEARQPDREAPAAGTDATGGPVPESEAEPEFDLSSLPKLDELTSTTDITGFLRKGVPEHLRNAALQKAWALDPAIRNYVNPALEYAYDWNTPGGVPGSSEIGAGMDVARLVAQIMGSGASSAEPLSPAADPGSEAASGAGQVPGHDPSPKSEPDLPVHSLRLGDEAILTAKAASDAEGAAFVAIPAAESQAKNSVAPQQPVRRHGSAKPIV